MRSDEVEGFLAVGGAQQVKLSRFAQDAVNIPPHKFVVVCDQNHRLLTPHPRLAEEEDMREFG